MLIDREKCDGKFTSSLASSTVQSICPRIVESLHSCCFFGWFGAAGCSEGYQTGSELHPMVVIFFLKDVPEVTNV